jgi:hypothetical protein
MGGAFCPIARHAVTGTFTPPGDGAPGDDAHAVELSMCWHVHPVGWCSQGRKESNLHYWFWRPALCLVKLRPYVMKRAAWLGFPCWRLLDGTCCLESYPGALGAPVLWYSGRQTNRLRPFCCSLSDDHNIMTPWYGCRWRVPTGFPAVLPWPGWCTGCPATGPERGSTSLHFHYSSARPGGVSTPYRRPAYRW